jgi:hypothetical protein
MYELSLFFISKQISLKNSTRHDFSLKICYNVTRQISNIISKYILGLNKLFISINGDV